MSPSTYVPDAATLGTGLLLGRLILGALMVGHGAQKLFGWFGGSGMAGTAGYFEQLGFRPGRLFVITAALSEVTSGFLIGLGLFGPVGPALLLSVMIVAAVSVHWKNGVFATANGIEVPLLYAAGAVALAFTGFGPFSLDAALGIGHIWTPALKAAAVAVGAAGGVVNLLARRSAAVAATA
ncbi:MAG TPA: DoxX family protein [Gemmatimonadales bacterium]|nr:DoxX family protein [Gemmatimonadales bacterium]